MENGTGLQAPDDDAMIPAAQQGAPFLSLPLDLVDSVFDTQRVDRSHAPIPNVRTPERSDADLGAPSPSRARTTSQDAKGAGDTEPRARHGSVGWDRVGKFAPAKDNFYHSLRNPVLAWPAYTVLFGTDGPGPHTKHRISGKENFQNALVAHSCIRQTGTGPL